MERSRIEPLLEDGKRWPLAAMNSIDPLTLWATDRETASRFYAQSWALYRFLSLEAPKDVRGRFEEWQAMCRATAAGHGAPGGSAPASAEQLFDQLFGADLARIEAAFVEWLRSL
jgi:hypothetical protein